MQAVEILALVGDGVQGIAEHRDRRAGSQREGLPASESADGDRRGRGKRRQADERRGDRDEVPDVQLELRRAVEREDEQTSEHAEGDEPHEDGGRALEHETAAPYAVREGELEAAALLVAGDGCGAPGDRGDAQQQEAHEPEVGRLDVAGAGGEGVAEGVDELLRQAVHERLHALRLHRRVERDVEQHGRGDPDRPAEEGAPRLADRAGEERHGVHAVTSSLTSASASAW